MTDLTDGQIFGKNDTHVPPEGRDLIRRTLHEKGVLFGFYEVAWAQRKLFGLVWFYFMAGCNVIPYAQERGLERTIELTGQMHLSATS